MTFIILFGIVGGVLTPSKASVIAALYAIGIGAVIYKQLSLRAIFKSLLEITYASTAILSLVGFANLFAWILAIEQISSEISHFFLHITENKYILLILVSILLLCIGAFMQTIASLLVVFPSLFTIGNNSRSGSHTCCYSDDTQFDDRIYYSTCRGMSIFGASIGKISLWEATKGVFPFFL